MRLGRLGERGYKSRPRRKQGPGRLTREELCNFLLGAAKGQAPQSNAAVVEGVLLVCSTALHHPIHFTPFRLKHCTEQVPPLTGYSHRETLPPQSLHPKLKKARKSCNSTKTWHLQALPVLLKGCKSRLTRYPVSKRRNVGQGSDVPPLRPVPSVCRSNRVPSLDCPESGVKRTRVSPQSARG